MPVKLPAKAVWIDQKTKKLNINIWPKQRDFIDNDDVDEILFGGAVGGGKSHSLLLFCLKRRMQHPGSRGIVFRRHYPDLKRTLIAKAHNFFLHVGAKYNQTDHTWKFKNGSVQEFGALETDADVYKYHSSEYDDLCFDELTTFTQFQFEYMTSRCRTALPGVKALIRCTSNPGNIGHCVRQGEVLTTNGWKDIKECREGDKVFSIDKNGYLFPYEVKQKHICWFSGHLAQVDQDNLFLECTPDHRVVKYRGKKGQKNRLWSLVEFKHLPNQAQILRSVKWEGHSFNFNLPVVSTRRLRLKQPFKLSGKDFCTFMGYFLSEGSVVMNTRCAKRFSISQMKPIIRKKINGFLVRVGFKGRWDKQSFNIHSPSWWEYLKQFGKSRDKFIPKEIKNSSYEELKCFFEAAMDGDGHWRTKWLSGCYYTISKQLAEDMAEVMVKLGYLVRLTSRQRKFRVGLCYEIFFQTTKNGVSEFLTGNHVYDVGTCTKRKSKVKYIPYRGLVYCLGIPKTHAFVIRQQGSVWLSGNSWVKQRYIDPAKVHSKWYLESEKKTLSFIPARLEDNPSLRVNDPTYEDRLKILGDKKYRALRFGDWEVFEGQFFNEWNARLHVLDRNRIPDTSNRKFLSMDWGYASPSAIYWWEVLTSGRVIIYRELYVTRLAPKELAQAVCDLSPHEERYQYLSSPPELWGKEIELEGGGQPIQKLMQSVFNKLRPDITMQKANNARVPGWTKLREYLRLAPDGLPWLQVSPCCENLVRTLPMMIHDEHKVEDCDTDGEDHASDSVRMGIVSLNTMPRTSLSPYGVQSMDHIIADEHEYEPISRVAISGSSGYGARRLGE